MATILRMPEVMANATEAVIAAWLVEEGQPFLAGEVLAEIETEKALVELTAEADGILGRQLARPGATTAVGAPIAVLVRAGETDAEIAAAVNEAAPVHATASPGEPALSRAETSSAGRLFASPLARRMLRERGIDPGSVTGTGPAGRIVRRDVDAALAAGQATAGQATAGQATAGQATAGQATAGQATAGQATAGQATAGQATAGQATAGQAAAAVPEPAVPPSAAPHAGYTSVPHTAMRRAIARRLTESKSTVPHFYLAADCRVDRLLALRAEINEASPVKISVNDLVVKAVAAAFRDVPEANVTWRETELRRYDQVDIAVAVATDGGLLTPVVRGVDRLSLSDLSSAVSELAGRARAGRLRQDELEGGSFSVTNLGMYGTSDFSAIINPPQSGILAVGAARPQAVVSDGALAVATILCCTLSVDHRAIDGALAARWLAAFTTRIEHPVTLLI
jgi:pyruvate dehydrogenase E2 component (dihydrolipoamide acetyltransferase)